MHVYLQTIFSFFKIFTFQIFRIFVFVNMGPHIGAILSTRPRGLDDLLDLLPDETNIALWIMAM